MTEYPRDHKNAMQLSKTMDETGVYVWSNGRTIYFDNEMWAELVALIPEFTDDVQLISNIEEDKR